MRNIQNGVTPTTTKSGWIFVGSYKFSGANAWSKAVDDEHGKKTIHSARNLADVFSAKIYGKITHGGEEPAPIPDWSLEGKARNDYFVDPDEMYIYLHTKAIKTFTAKEDDDDSDGTESNWKIKPLYGGDEVFGGGNMKTLRISGSETWWSDTDFRASSAGKFIVEAEMVDNPNQKDSALLTVYDLKLKSVDFAGNGNHVLRKQGNDDWRNDKYADDGNVVINYPEWQDNDLDGTPEKDDPVCYTKNSSPSMNAIFAVVPEIEGADAAKLRFKNDDNVWATKDFSITGKEITLSGIQWTDNLPDKVGGILTWMFTWEVSTDAGTSYFVFAENGTDIVVVYDTPIADPTITAKRVNWSSSIGAGQNTKTYIALQVRNHVAENPGFDLDYYNEQPWNFLDRNKAGDCISLSRLVCAGLHMLGVPAQEGRAFPTADGTEGYPPVNPATCSTQTVKQFLYNGETLRARLIYYSDEGRGVNNFEGYFTINDPNIIAFTVAPPRGPFENQNYYRLEVLRGIEVTEQYWVWNGKQTINRAYP